MSKPRGERTPMLEQFMAIKRQHPDSILFYRMGDFYEMFYDDAKIASEVLGLRLTSRSHGKGVSVPLAGFPYHQLDSYLTKMVRAGWRVVIVEQTEDPKKAKGLVKRDVSRIVTAGTNPAAVDRDDPKAVRVGALLQDCDSYGFAWADVTNGEFATGQFTKHELRQTVAHVNPVELLVPERDDVPGVSNWEIGPDVSVSRIEDWIWETSFARKTLLDHFGTVGLKGFGIDDLDPAVSAAGALLHYLKGNLRVDPTHITGLTHARTAGRLYLEAATRRNLELVESLTGNRQATLFEVIDRSVTMPGRRLLYNRLLDPLADIERIEERLDAVDHFARDGDLREWLRQLLKRSGDLQRFLARLVTGRGSARDLIAIRDSLGLMPDYMDLLREVESSLVRKQFGRIDPLNDLVDLLKQTIVDEPPLATTEGGMIRDGYDEEIDELRRIQHSGKTWLQEFEQRERQRTGIPKLKVGFNRVFGYYMEVSRAHADKVPEYFTRRQTLVNAERYTVPELQEYEEKLIGATERIAQRELDIYMQVVEQTLARSAEIQENARALAELDVQCGLAELATEENYHRPILDDSDRIVLRESRHPVVEKLIPPGEEFIVNDLEIGGDGARILIVTGPNMAGKSTYLRQIGLTVILAQMGSFVPAVEARIGLVDKLFTRIGALDNLAGGESTFMIEMQETASILHNATPRSLVMFDEVGRGTSTFDGLSLAWSIVEYLHETPDLKPRTLFATHYHEMVDLEQYLPLVTNRNVAVKEYGDKVVFLRKIVGGGSDRSFGIHVAQMAGLPPAVIARANEVLRNLEENDLKPGLQSAKQPSAERKRLPKKHVAQLVLFDTVEPKLRERMKSVDVDRLTPVEALGVLAELKRMSEEGI